MRSSARLRASCAGVMSASETSGAGAGVLAGAGAGGVPAAAEVWSILQGSGAVRGDTSAAAAVSALAAERACWREVRVR